MSARVPLLVSTAYPSGSGVVIAVHQRVLGPSRAQYANPTGSP
ncbi:hypothetical protein ACIHCQ_11150 [Streptomyces sp. NPDC052236]